MPIETDILLVLKLRDAPHMSTLQKVMREVTENQDVAVDTGWIAIDDEAEMVLDVFKEPELGGGRHVVDVRSRDGIGAWVIEHSLICRRTGEMTDCPWIAVVNDLNYTSGFPHPGRFELSRGETGALILTHLET